MTFSQLILNWIHQFGRKNLPWQYKSPYEIWISEIMLQQTKVKTVIPYFNKFIKTFPDIQKLAHSSLDKIMNVWSGMGYYTRAKNIHITANIIVKIYDSCFPDDYHRIIKLPGIGKTTAGSILSLAFGFYFPILDGNVKRILSRVYLINGKLTLNETNKKLWKTIEQLTPIYHTDKFNQGIMDLGSLICKIKNPKCHICPLNTICKSYKKMLWNQFPNKKNSITTKKKIFSVIIKYKSSFLLTKIKNQKLWHNLFTFPIFNNQKMLFLWLTTNKLNNEKILYLPEYHCNITNSKLILKNILINISSKTTTKNIFCKIWYNINKPKKIGIPKPIQIILRDLGKK